MTDFTTDDIVRVISGEFMGCVGYVLDAEDDRVNVKLEFNAVSGEDLPADAEALFEPDELEID